MPDLNAIAERFVALMPEKKREAVARTLRTVMTAYDAGSIFNVDYNDAKSRLSYVVEAAREQHISRPYTMGRGGNNPESHVTWALMTHSLHDYLAKAKKLHAVLAQHQPSAEFQRDLIAFYDAVVPVAQIMAELKSKVVKGRKPNPEAIARRVAAEEKKTVRTCAVCLRPIAIHKNGAIADHGYRLPQQTWKTASCPGQGFPPIEVSPLGIEHMVKLLTRDVAHFEGALREAPARTSITRTKPHSFRGETETFTPGDPGWANAYAWVIDGLKNDLAATKRALAQFQKRLASWKPTPEGRYSGGKRRHGKPSTVGRLNADVRNLLRK